MSMLGERMAEDLTRTGNMVLRVVLRHTLHETARPIRHLLRDAAKKALDFLKKDDKKELPGEISLEQLKASGEALSYVSVPGEDIENYRAELSKYNVDFALMKSSEGTYEVWYRGKNLTQIEQALKNTFSGLSKDLENEKPSLDEKILEKKVEAAKAASKSREKTAKRIKDRSAQL